MDRMVVAGDGLERCEIGVGDGPARNIKPLADDEILEISAFRVAVLPMVEIVAHGAPGSSKTPSAARRPITISSRPNSSRTALPCSPMPGAGGIVRSNSGGTPGVRGV